MAELTEAQRRVLERGYCILFLDHARPVDVAYRTWAGLIDRGWIEHSISRLAARRPFERYAITPAGRTALGGTDV